MPLRILALLVAGLGLARAGDPPALTVAHAGSISAGLKAVAELYTQRTGVKVVEIAGGSVSLARRIAAGKVECDLYASADFENIDQMLKPAGLADFTLRIAQGAMVLAYTTGSRNAATIAASGPFQPPASVPAAAADWYAQVTQPGVHIAGAHPFLDPGGYRADLIFQLAQDLYQVPNLYDDLLSHLVIGSAHATSGDGVFALAARLDNGDLGLYVTNAGGTTTFSDVTARSGAPAAAGDPEVFLDPYGNVDLLYVTTAHRLEMIAPQAARSPRHANIASGDPPAPP